eukprot:364906-Chlamydomonas_euryale.AAC.13
MFVNGQVDRIICLGCPSLADDGTQCHASACRRPGAPMPNLHNIGMQETLWVVVVNQHWRVVSPASSVRLFHYDSLVSTSERVMYVLLHASGCGGSTHTGS